MPPPFNRETALQFPPQARLPEAGRPMSRSMTSSVRQQLARYHTGHGSSGVKRNTKPHQWGSGQAARWKPSSRTGCDRLRSLRGTSQQAHLRRRSGQDGSAVQFVHAGADCPRLLTASGSAPAATSFRIASRAASPALSSQEYIASQPRPRALHPSRNPLHADRCDTAKMVNAASESLSEPSRCARRMSVLPRRGYPGLRWNYHDACVDVGKKPPNHRRIGAIEASSLSTPYTSFSPL